MPPFPGSLDGLSCHSQSLGGTARDSGPSGVSIRSSTGLSPWLLELLPTCPLKHAAGTLGRCRRMLRRSSWSSDLQRLGMQGHIIHQELTIGRPVLVLPSGVIFHIYQGTLQALLDAEVIDLFKHGLHALFAFIFGQDFHHAKAILLQSCSHTLRITGVKAVHETILQGGIAGKQALPLLFRSNLLWWPLDPQ